MAHNVSENYAAPLRTIRRSEAVKMCATWSELCNLHIKSDVFSMLEFRISPFMVPPVMIQFESLHRFFYHRNKQISKANFITY